MSRYEAAGAGSAAQSTLGLVAAELGFALVPAPMQGVHMNGAVYRRLQGARPKAFLGLAWRRADPSPALKQFVSLVRMAAGRLGAGPAG